LVGRIGQDPILRTTRTGKKVANFSLATSRKTKGSDGAEGKETLWHRVVVWGNEAERCMSNVKKGASVMVQGEVRPRTYKDTQGNERLVTEIHSDDVYLIDRMSRTRVEDSGIQNPAESIEIEAAVPS
jgi:single-strand DNA-binding protein